LSRQVRVAQLRQSFLLDLANPFVSESKPFGNRLEAERLTILQTEAQLNNATFASA
jgi:hypothetical protein